MIWVGGFKVSIILTLKMTSNYNDLPYMYNGIKFDLVSQKWYNV